MLEDLTIACSNSKPPETGILYFNVDYKITNTFLSNILSLGHEERCFLKLTHSWFEVLKNLSAIRQKSQKAPKKSHYDSNGDVRSDITNNYRMTSQRNRKNITKKIRMYWWHLKEKHEKHTCTIHCLASPFFFLKLNFSTKKITLQNYYNAILC